MNIKDHHTIQELQKLYRKEKNARLTRRMYGIELSSCRVQYYTLTTVLGA